ncbi:MAG: hypothetical protein KAH20_16735 [Methylococcales bacterium]|nr:hypothetical protein [Methylococcales bacterium]
MGDNEIGNKATEEALQKFDIDRSPIKLGEVKMTVRDKTNKLIKHPMEVFLFSALFINLQKVEKPTAHWKITPNN